VSGQHGKRHQQADHAADGDRQQRQLKAQPQPRQQGVEVAPHGGKVQLIVHGQQYLERGAFIAAPLILKKWKRRERRKDKAKTGEKAELALANEHFESVFNAVFPSAAVFI
jgi:hypothetical protein